MNETKSRAERYLRLAALAIPAGILTFLAFTTTFSSDDYWYSTFWNQGLKHYIELTIQHYQTFNGRVLVHIFAQTVLHFGTWFFAPFCIGLTLSIPFLSSGMGRRKASKCVTAAVFCAGVLLLPRDFFTTGYLWISAFSNYVLPTAMITLELYLLSRAARRELPVWGMVLLPLYAFLCGATTEQSGITSVVLVLAFTGEMLIFRRGLPALAVSFLSALTTGLGLATVFLSPATRYRAGNELVEDLWVQLQKGFGEEAEFFLGDLRLCLMLGALFLILGAWLRLSGTPAAGSRPGVSAPGPKPRHNPGRWTGIVLCGCLAAAAVIVHFFAMEHGTLAWAILFAAMAVIALAVFLLQEDKAPAYLILAALTSAGAISLTHSVAARTLLPSLLYLLAGGGRMLALMLKGRRATAAVCCLSLAGMVNMLPQLPGYWHNYLVEQENWAYIRQAQETRVLYCNVDYLSDYSHLKMCNDTYFYYTFLDMAGMGREGDQIYMFSEGCYTLYIDGVRATVPGYEQDGVWYVYVRSLGSLGVSVDYSPEWTVISRGERSCVLTEKEILYTASDGTEQSMPFVVLEPFTAFKFVPEFICTEILGLDMEIDPDARTIRITAPDGT